MVRKRPAGKRRAEKDETEQPKKRVLFFCACNAIHSQMAAGFLRSSHGDRYEVFSAGLKPSSVAPLAIRVMAERGIDISGSASKSVDSFVGERFDSVALVCGDPAGPCPFAPPDRGDFVCRGCHSCCAFYPFFPAGRRVLHARFGNLPDRGDSEEDTRLFREMRDEIGRWVEEIFGKAIDV